MNYELCTSHLRRWLAFNGVGALGFVVQTVALWLLVEHGGLTPPIATLAATELAIVHNFVWHERWTWRDRPARGRRRAGRLLRFNITNGAVSLPGNVALVALLTGIAHLHYLAAALGAVLACSVLNFLLSDVLVFEKSAAGERAGQACYNGRFSIPAEFAAVRRPLGRGAGGPRSGV